MVLDPLTGHATSPETGIVEASAGSALSLRDEDLPLKITAPSGRKYVIQATRAGELIMTGAEDAMRRRDC